MRTIISAITILLFCIIPTLAAEKEGPNPTSEEESAEVPPPDIEEDTPPPPVEAEAPPTDDEESVPHKDAGAVPPSPTPVAASAAAQKIETQKADVSEREAELEQLQRDSQLARDKVTQDIATLTTALAEQKETLSTTEQALINIHQQITPHITNNTILLEELSTQLQRDKTSLTTKEAETKAHSDTIASLTAANKAKEVELQKLRALQIEKQAEKQAITDDARALLEKYK